MTTTLALELRRQIAVLRAQADYVIFGHRGTVQAELFRVATALENHLLNLPITAGEKIQAIRAELTALYQRLESEPDKAPKHFARLRTAVEVIIGRNDPVTPESICGGKAESEPGVITAELTAEQMSGATVSSEAHPAVGQCCSCGIFTSDAKRIGKTCLRFVGGKKCQGVFEPLEAHDPPMKVEETDGAEAQRKKCEPKTVTMQRPSLDSSALALMRKSAEKLRERVNMLHDRGWSETASTVEEVTAELESFCDCAKETPEPAEDYQRRIPALHAMTQERDDLKGRLEQSAMKNKDLDIESDRLAELLHRTISDQDALRQKIEAIRFTLSEL